MTRQEENKILTTMLQDFIRHLKDDDFDNESKQFYYEQCLKILEKMKDINLL